MYAEFKQTLRRLRGSIIGQAPGVGFYGLLTAFFCPCGDGQYGG